MPFNPREICTLTVDGREYKDWKSITVYLCYKEPFNYYRFTCSEVFPMSKVFNEIQIRPGMMCTVTLGGEFAIGGFVTTRQVAYTEKAHGVEITGKSFTYTTVNGAASIKGGELEGKTFPEIATAILKPFGLTFVPKGAIDMRPFERVNVTGQTAWEVLEMAARQRNILLGTDPYDGTVMWGTAKEYTEGGDMVEEGVNILEGRETISMEFGSGAFVSFAQGAPTVKQWGPEITSLPYFSLMSGFAKSFLGVGAGPFMPLASIAELPGKKEDAKGRAGAENSAVSAEQIKVETVLQGWFNSQGRLWRPWMKVHVRSPMLIMDRPLTLKAVTFTQDDRSGTRATLELWNEVGEKGPSFK